MKRKNIIRIITFACVGVFVAATLGGCTGQNNAANEQQAGNRTYMAQVNQIVEDMNSRLASFNDAVSRNDLVGMKTQASSAFKSIDDLSALETPEDLKDIQKDYVDGCNSLKDALNAYVDLYTEVENATEAAPFDYATYDSRLKDIQQKYDDGISALESGDKKATEKS